MKYILLIISIIFSISLPIVGRFSLDSSMNFFSSKNTHVFAVDISLVPLPLGKDFLIFFCLAYESERFLHIVGITEPELKNKI